MLLGVVGVNILVELLTELLAAEAQLQAEAQAVVAVIAGQQVLMGVMNLVAMQDIILHIPVEDTGAVPVLAEPQVLALVATAAEAAAVTAAEAAEEATDPPLLVPEEATVETDSMA